MYERVRVNRRPAAGPAGQQATVGRRPAHPPVVVQAKLRVGAADDPLERDADRAAEQVMALLGGTTVAPDAEATGRVRPSGSAPVAPAAAPAASRIRRRAMTPSDAPVQVGREGGPIDGELASRIRSTAGRGAPLEPQLRGPLESAFASDFGGVRIHADSELAPQIGAEAFTSGNDIHFAPGLYRPGDSSGQRLLSHELAHVVQQNGPIARKTVPAVADHAGGTGVDVPAQVQQDRRSDVVRASFGKKIKQGFKTAKKKIKTVFGKADPQSDAETGDDVYDSLSHETKMENQRKVRGGGPGENPDYSNTKLWGATPDRYVVTLAVAQEDPAWMKNVNALKSEAIRALVKSPTALLDDLPNAQKTIVRQTLLRQGKLVGKDESEIGALVDEFTDGIHDVGHTWVRLGAYVGNELKELYSYGMWPQKMYSPSNGEEYGGYAGFVVAGPGEIRHPDLAHEGDSMKAYKDYEVSAKSFDAALDLAVARYNSPPPYVLTGYNCTAFAREVVMAAGKTYPGKGLLPGFAYTPGDLYWAIMHEWARGKKGARTNENEEEAIASVAKRQEVWEEAGIKDVSLSYLTQVGPDDTFAKKRKLFSGHTLRFGEDPRRVDQSLKLDKDMEVVAVFDDDFIDHLGVVPLKFGSFYWYADAASFDIASAPTKAKPSGSGDAPAGLALYNGTFQPPQPGDKPIRYFGVAEARKLTPMRTVGAFTEVSDRGDIFWAATAELTRILNPGQKDEQDDTSSGSVGLPVLAWFTSSTQSVAMWKPDGEEIKTGVVRVEGNKIGATGRTVQAGSDLMVEYVLGSVRAWMPAIWWQMYTDNAYPTEPVTLNDQAVDEISDQLDDDLDDLESSSEYIEEEPVSAMSPEELARAQAKAVEALSDFAFVDLSTIASVISGKGYGGLTEELLLELLTGDGAQERCQELADAVGASPEDLMATFGPQR